jgi:hypothetical protein
MSLRAGRDSLLIAARVVITMLLGLIFLGGLAALIGAPTVLILKAGVTEFAVRHSRVPVGPEIVAEICAMLAMLAILAGLAFQFLVLLRRIIDSVASGDSFALVNADRLTQMGWLTAAIQLLSIPLGALSHLIHLVFRKDATPDFDMSLDGILMALVLFILARVFREGARMRADLEGTV